MSEETRCQQGKELIDCAHQRKNDDLRWLRPDGETQVQTIPKQVLRIQLQPREQIAEVPIVLHFEQLVENPQLIAEAVVQVPAWCTVCRQRMFLKSWRRSVKLWDRLMAHC